MVCRTSLWEMNKSMSPLHTAAQARLALVKLLSLFPNVHDYLVESVRSRDTASDPPKRGSGSRECDDVSSRKRSPENYECRNRKAV